MSILTHLSFFLYLLFLRVTSALNICIRRLWNSLFKSGQITLCLLLILHQLFWVITAKIRSNHKLEQAGYSSTLLLSRTIGGHHKVNEIGSEKYCVVIQLQLCYCSFSPMLLLISIERIEPPFSNMKGNTTLHRYLHCHCLSTTMNACSTERFRFTTSFLRVLISN